ncbi:MAG TPA: AmmeMemoRadiSam system protein B [Candidatus Limnocylindrales bacterium]|nr:AmmeMemoRadiSam system protein B [Candidatus Limnocylindrales bacterium]
MTGRSFVPEVAERVRMPWVAGEFYPATADRVRKVVHELFAETRWLAGDAARLSPELPAGLLVPHAGLVYSGVVAAAGWARLDARGVVAGGHPREPVVVILGTNHGAGWLQGVAASSAAAWRVPGGDVRVDQELVAAIVDLGPPFIVDDDAHEREHSIEVQLPLLHEVAPRASIVPLAVSAGTGHPAIAAGRRLGELLASRRAAGTPIVLAISSDMAHYPPAAACEEVTEALWPPIRTLDAVGVASREIALRSARIPGLVCGMCGIQPTVLGLAALRAMGAIAGVRIAAATSADADGPRDRTVGYLAVAFGA